MERDDLRFRQVIVSQSIRFAKAASNKDNPWPVRAVCAFATLYLLSPIDTIPDFIPIFGYLDDFLVIFGVVMWVINRRKNMPLQP